MHQFMKRQVADLNPQLICQLCGGYYIDATTIIECLHSFCRSCIVRYLEKNKFCPICEVQVHKTRPLLNIRSDQTLQDIVYKLVPGLFQNEMKLRKEFYSKHPEVALPLNPEDQGEPSERCIYSADETICISLEYWTGGDESKQPDTEIEDKEQDAHGGKRYLRCPAAVTVGLLKRLIRGKYGLDVNHILDIICSDSSLRDEYSLVDVAYISNWKRKGPLRLEYRIYERVLSNIPVVNGNSSASSVESEVKSDAVPQDIDQIEVPAIKEESRADPVLEEERKPAEQGASGASASPPSDNKEVRLEISESEVLNAVKAEEVETVIPSTTVSSAIVSSETAKTKQAPQAEPLAPAEPPTVSPAESKSSAEAPTVPVNGSTASPPSAVPPASPSMSPSKKASSPVGYKTLKSPPKTWNPSVGRVATKRPATTLSSSSTNNTSSITASSCSSLSVRTVNSCSSPTPAVSVANDWDGCRPPTPKQAKRAAPLAAPSSPKVPKFFKVRNTAPTTASCPANSTTTNHVSSIASVTESPVQEVAVNLTKVSHGTKKSSKEARVPSPSLMITKPPPSSSPTPRPSSAPAQLKPQPLLLPSALPSPTSCSEDAASKLRNLLAVFSAAPTSSSVTATNAALAESLHLHFPSWLNAVRPGPRSPLPVPPGASFLNRPPLPPHLLSNLIASQQFPYFPHQLNFGLGPLVAPFPEVKKSPLTPSSPSSTAAGPALQSVSSASHKSPSPRPSTGLHTPIFNLPPYSTGLAPLLPGLPVGSMYTTLAPRPYSAIRSSVPANAGNSSDGQSNSHTFLKTPSSPSGGGFHSSLPPTVSPMTSSKGSSASKSGLRPLMPRKAVAPPPPLVPIRLGGPSNKNPPVLLPIKEDQAGDNASRKESATPGLSPAKKAKESSAVEAEPVKESLPSDGSTEKANTTTDKTNNCVPVENGKVSPETMVPSSDTSSKTTITSPNGEEKVSEIPSRTTSVTNCSKEADTPSAAGDKTLENDKGTSAESLADSRTTTETVSAT